MLSGLQSSVSLDPSWRGRAWNRAVVGAQQPCDTPHGIPAPGEDVQLWIMLQIWWELKILPSVPCKTVVDLWLHSFALQAEEGRAVHLSQPTGDVQGVQNCVPGSGSGVGLKWGDQVKLPSWTSLGKGGKTMQQLGRALIWHCYSYFWYFQNYFPVTAVEFGWFLVWSFLAINDSPSLIYFYYPAACHMLVKSCAAERNIFPLSHFLISWFIV